MFTGIVGTSYGIAAVVGPLIGGALSDKASWWCFYINLPIGAISFIIILLFFQTPGTAKLQVASLFEKLSQMDPVGVVLALGAIVSYRLAMHYGGEQYPWNSSRIIRLLVGTFALFGAFAFWEWCQGDRAMVPFRLARQRVYFVGSIFSFFYSGAFYLVIYCLPIYFQAIDNISPQMSGVRNLPFVIAVTIAMVASGSYISFSGIVAPVIAFGTALPVICTGLLYSLNIGTSEGK